jgi:hypothetical protein
LLPHRYFRIAGDGPVKPLSSTNLWFSYQVGSHGLSIGANFEVAVAQQAQDRIRPEVPTRPTERRVPKNIQSVELRPMLQKQFDRGLASECGSTVKRGFTSGSCVSHEAATFDATSGDGVGVRSRRKQHLSMFRQRLKPLIDGSVDTDQVRNFEEGSESNHSR